MKYYIRITDEEPLESDKALWFGLDTDTEDNGELFVLKKNEYNELVATFNNIENHFEEEYVLPIITDKMDEVLGDESFRVMNSQNATNLTDINNPSNKYTYSDITSRLSDKADKETTQNTISEIQTTLNDATTSIENLTNGKSDKNHIHGTWESATFGDYGTIYYNNSLKMCFLQYYRTNYNFRTTASITLHNIVHNKYKPKYQTKLSAFHPNLGAYMGTDGNFVVLPSTTGTMNINISGFWICNGE